MSRLIILCCVVVLFSFNLFGQSDSIILRIENDKFTRGEFDFIYNKNNQVSTVKKSEKEYLDLFVNYKLKVHEAEKLGYDTLQSFKDELAFYQDELAKPYLTDKGVTEELVKEAYAHIENEVDASHILILIPKNPTPADTLKAYNKIVDIQKQLSNGADFAQMATAYSEDPSAVKNAGRLGYFAGFMMVYPFEKAAYQTPVGGVSPIVKTQFGYHLIYVHGIRKARGEIRVAHIMRVFPRNSSPEVIAEVKLTIDSVYTKLQSGAKFEDLAVTYSEDGNTARKGGELPWFTANKMIPEFANPAFELKNDGDVSLPIQTPFGWHIIKRLEHKGVGSFEKMKPELESRIAQDERAYSGQKAIVRRLKLEYGFKTDSANFALLSAFVEPPLISDSLFYAEDTNNSNTLFSFGGKEFKVYDFKQFLQNKKQFSLRFGLVQLNNNYSEFQDQAILNYEKSRLTIKYPSYSYLLEEYHDGLLIFEISKKEIWDKASADTVGLKEYYLAHKADFKAPKQFVGRVFYCANKGVQKSVKPFVSAPKVQLDSVVKSLNVKGEVVSYLDGSFAANDNAVVDLKIFKIENSKELYKPNLLITFLNGKVNDVKERSFEEAKGAVISDYQNYLDKQWVNTLHEKYKPQIGSL